MCVCVIMWKVYRTERARVLCAQLGRADGPAGGRQVGPGPARARTIYAAWFLHISPVLVADSCTSTAFRRLRRTTFEPLRCLASHNTRDIFIINYLVKIIYS